MTADWRAVEAKLGGRQVVVVKKKFERTRESSRGFSL